uniref:Uncharacterized protein n=1 Tax=Oryza sativa subsp. japonica TaxID=39947 RepID=Q6YUI2_ORYSJ|nr:hypothetical protein [Oryza sativa Japonica Group]BAD08169.1 hypothetical protein [Oryza sativa Japonica Group]
MAGAAEASDRACVRSVSLSSRSRPLPRARGEEGTDRSKISRPPRSPPGFLHVRYDAIRARAAAAYVAACCRRPVGVVVPARLASSSRVPTCRARSARRSTDQKALRKLHARSMTPDRYQAGA